MEIINKIRFDADSLYSERNDYCNIEPIAEIGGKTPLAYERPNDGCSCNRDWIGDPEPVKLNGPKNIIPSPLITGVPMKDPSIRLKTVLNLKSMWRARTALLPAVFLRRQIIL